jgi:hypothetical protein
MYIFPMYIFPSVNYGLETSVNYGLEKASFKIIRDYVQVLGAMSTP